MGQNGPSPGVYSTGQKPFNESSPHFCDFNHNYPGYFSELRVPMTFITCSSGELKFGQKPDMQLKCTNTKIHTQPATLVNCKKNHSFSKYEK